jgi:hypothetical protein
MLVNSLKALLFTLFLPVMVTASEVIEVPVANCSDGTTTTITRYFTLDGWLGAALMAALLHVLVRKSRLSTWRYADGALIAATLALLVGAPVLVAYLSPGLRLGVSGPGPHVFHALTWKGTFGVVGFAGLLAYRLEVKAATAVFLIGWLIAAGLYVSAPASGVAEVKPHTIHGHGVCDSESYGF